MKKHSITSERAVGKNLRSYARSEFYAGVRVRAEASVPRTAKRCLCLSVPHSRGGFVALSGPYPRGRGPFVTPGRDPSTARSSSPTPAHGSRQLRDISSELLKVSHRFGASVWLRTRRMSAHLNRVELCSLSAAEKSLRESVECRLIARQGYVRTHTRCAAKL